MDKNSKIAVVGAGISGLALSIALKQLGFRNIKIFEKDASFDSRRQGYGLTILQGKSALRELGVL
jgi:2-polyprenyl-6-methoxyphenol hydroxylase-like FAD-dependent oxidoreductase